MVGFLTNTVNKKDKRQRQLPKLLLLKSNLQLILAFLISNDAIWIFCPPATRRFWSQDINELHAHLWPHEMHSTLSSMLLFYFPPPLLLLLLLFATSPCLWEGEVQGWLLRPYYLFPPTNPLSAFYSFLPSFFFCYLKSYCVCSKLNLPWGWKEK